MSHVERDPASIGTGLRPTLECQACGQWHAFAACPTCGGDRAARGEALALRVLVEFCVDTERRVRFVRVVSARLPWLVRDASLAARLTSLCDGEPADAVEWPLLASTIDTAAREAISEAIARHAGIPSPGVAATVRVTRRLSVQAFDYEVAAGKTWEVRGFDTAVSIAAQGLDANTVRYDAKDTSVRAYPGPDAPLRVRSPSTVWVANCSIVGPYGNRLVERSLGKPLVAGTWCPVELPVLGTVLGQRLAGLGETLTGLDGYTIQLHLLGRPGPLSTPLLPSMVADLPRSGRRVTVAFDLGGTTTRFATWERDRSATDGVTTLRDPDFQVEDTERALRRLALPAVLPRDGGSLNGWVAASLPELARYVAETHGAWLDTLLVAFRGSESGLAVDVETLQKATTKHLLGTVRVPDRAALFAPKVEMLRTLRRAELEHDAQHAAQVRKYDTAIAAWRDRTWAQKDPLRKWITAAPGAEPVAPLSHTPLGIIPAPLRNAIEADRFIVVEIGAGGAAVIVVGSDKHSVRPLSACGGDEISRRLGLTERMSAAAATELKARWGASRDTRDSMVNAYAGVSEAVAKDVVKAVIEATNAWKDGPCIVLFSGGGAENPFLQDAVSKALAVSAPQARFVDASLLGSIAEAAKAAGLGGLLVERVVFAASVERQRMLRPGSLDVAAGLWLNEVSDGNGVQK